MNDFSNIKRGFQFGLELKENNTITYRPVEILTVYNLKMNYLLCICKDLILDKQYDYKIYKDTLLHPLETKTEVFDVIDVDEPFLIVLDKIGNERRDIHVPQNELGKEIIKKLNEFPIIEVLFCSIYGVDEHKILKVKPSI